MTTEEVAKKLVELCQKGDSKTAIDTLYAQNIVSVEPRPMGDMPAEANGLDAVREKSKWWMENHEVHSMEVNGPFVARDTFVVRFGIDVTHKPSGKRMQGGEVGIYTVKDGKVTREEFLPLICDK
ncbi:MAG: nuclear transport factor 2 family protein [Chthoniobacterales bacterium]